MAPWVTCLMPKCGDTSSLPRTHIKLDAVRCVYNASTPADRKWRQENSWKFLGQLAWFILQQTRGSHLKNQNERQGSKHPRLSSDLHKQCVPGHLHNHSGRHEYCPSLVSVCCDKNNQSNLWRKTAILSYRLESTIKGSQGRELKAETTEKCCLQICSQTYIQLSFLYNPGRINPKNGSRKTTDPNLHGQIN